jgi:hypothetical protein
VAALLVCGPLLCALDCYGLAGHDLAGVRPFFLLMVALALATAGALARARKSAAAPALSLAT